MSEIKKTAAKKADFPEKGALGFLYCTPFGRMILKVLVSRWVSALAGAFADSRLSKPLIRQFIKNNSIDLNDYLETDRFRCFNDCFTRKIRPELRPVNNEASVLVSPCDGLVSVYGIESDTVYPVKQSSYTVSSLLDNEELAKRYYGGICVIIRLCVDNYHRYSFIDGGTADRPVFIKGKLHTVRPIALRKLPVFTENCREYTVMHTDNFGDVIQAEVGAMLVGKIHNHPINGRFSRGEEKGMFLYGGSTVILLFEKDRAAIDSEFFSATEDGIETPIKMGERLGEKARRNG